MNDEQMGILKDLLEALTPEQRSEAASFLREMEPLEDDFPTRKDLLLDFVKGILALGDLAGEPLSDPIVVPWEAWKVVVETDQTFSAAFGREPLKLRIREAGRVDFGPIGFVYLG